MITGKKKILSVLLSLLIVGCGWFAWSKLASTTRIALVNFQPFQTGSIITANKDGFISYDVVPLEELDKLKNYDFVLGFGMGMRITSVQREQIQSAAEKGTPVYIYAATNPENRICNLDSMQHNGIQEYLENGNKRNYQSLARFVRRYIDKKTLFVTPPDTAVEAASDVLFHLDENVWFDKVGSYEKYLRDKKYYVSGGANVAIVGGLNDPFSGNRENIDSLIVSLWHAGMNVYPIASVTKRLDFLKSIDPDIVIYFPHGRLAMGKADAATDWLKERNIPVLSPVSILQTKDEWEKDPMGMFGGFMSQSIVMPELDGAVYPYVLNAQEVDKDGIYLFKAITGRLKKFTDIVTNFVTLKKKNNSAKRVAIYFFKGAGQETLTAQGLETVPSLYNLLKRMKAEGYNVDSLPATEAGFSKLLMSQGAVLNTYAEGAFDQFLKSGNPALVDKADYESWVKQAIPHGVYADVVNNYGAAPGTYMSINKDGRQYLAVARIQLGNIALLPQPMAAAGGDAFAIIHGAKTAPPHSYIGAYLWARYAFNADAMIHFGTHGSLEFTPSKQVALSDNDWPDILVGTVPHFYYYTIGNVGESMMAKRRSYATVISYLTPPFMESNTRSQFKSLQEQIQAFYRTDEKLQPQASLRVKKIAVAMGLHRELRLDSVLTKPYGFEDIERIENFAEEIASEKMTGRLYTTGVPYEPEKIYSSVMAMTVDPIAYSVAALDRQRGKVTGKHLKNRVYFNEHYVRPARKLVDQILGGYVVDDALICRVANITEKKLEESKAITNPPKRGMRMSKDKKTEYTKTQKEEAFAIAEIERTINNVGAYKTALENSPGQELGSILNALSGGYVSPSSGGDAVANPNAVPTGRNLYAVNAEATPSETAWTNGMTLADNTLQQYKKQHGEYPRKVSYTFWSSEFIESEGATIAQVLYMLGVEPVRDMFGRVSDLRLIPSEVLGRPRIDVVVQTSGQFRDIAASRLSLLTRAIEMAAASQGDKYENFVSQNTVETERSLVEQGVTPKDARDLSTMRIFGGLNGMYGTGIQGMVISGDKWENEKEIADTYIQNMGAIYGTTEDWGEYKSGLLRAALNNTDIVVQPRQSNTWGALSLDHVYEFMGGINLAVREVTGKDPDAYFADYRNRNNMKMQELKEAIGVESRTTLFNPAYIKEVMKGNASSASQITELVTNTYGWNVMKPDVIDKEMWNGIYDVYVKDSHHLGVQKFFREQNPAALQEITAVMLETARKGMWHASEQQLADIAQLHTELVREFGPSGSGFAGSNIKLQDFIARNVGTKDAAQYRQQIKTIMQAADAGNDKDGMVLKKESITNEQRAETNSLNGLMIVCGVFVVFIALLIILRKKRKR